MNPVAEAAIRGLSYALLRRLYQGRLDYLLSAAIPSLTLRQMWSVATRSERKRMREMLLSEVRYFRGVRARNSASNTPSPAPSGSPTEPDAHPLDVTVRASGVTTVASGYYYMEINRL